MAEIIGISEIGITSNSLDIKPNTNGNEYEQVVHDNFQIYPKKLGITPEDASNGVYVYADDGLLYEPDSWETGRNDEAVGVAVVTDNTRLCVKKGIDAKNNIPWSNALHGTDVPEISNTRNDYKGLNNSIAIRKYTPSENEANNATQYCYSQSITVNGNTINGYLPANGELRDLYSNKSAVESALSLIGSETITEYCDYDTTPYLWSSSEYSDSPEGNAYTRYWNDSITFSGSGKDYRSGHGYTLPCFPLIPTLVDLGLPSGTLWSPTNLGAFKPEQAGYYYQWGDTIGWTKEQVGTDKIFNWANYKFGSSSNLTKYNSSDGKTVLDLEDDAVYATLGGNWKMPTHEDWKELYNNTEQQWTQVNDVNGYKCTASNGNYIFLPAAGRGHMSSLYYEGSDGYVWSSSLNSVGSPYAFNCNFFSGGFDPDYGYYRYYGFSVRGIYKPSN